MKLISWNVNGIRACLQKGIEDAFRTLNADFFCLQETKAQPHQVELRILRDDADARSTEMIGIQECA